MRGMDARIAQLAGERRQLQFQLAQVRHGIEVILAPILGLTH